MQTKQQIQLLLESVGVRPNKRLGQHFLIDLNLMTKIVEQANIAKDDVVLEVGCGTGSLTELLAETAHTVLAVEIDPTLAKIASQQLTENKNVQILNTDILQNKHTLSSVVTDAVEAARKKNKGRFLLIANLPYNAASAVLMNLVTAPPDAPIFADAMYVTVQKEVAERMTAKSAGKHYGTLSIFLDATGDVKILRTLKPPVFWPQPKVNSSMLCYVRNMEKYRRIEDMETFSRIVALFMQHRRKMLKAATKFATEKFTQLNWQQVFTQCGIDPCLRPENLCPEEYIRLANLCHETLKKNSINLQ